MTTAVCTKVDRKALLDALRGLQPSGLRDIRIPQNMDLGDIREREAVVGYWKRDEGEISSVPDFLVIPNNSSRELFAWVSTYCDSAAPLSQWCRIFSVGLFGSLKTLEIHPILGKLGPIWAGISIGESLAQAGGQTSPKELTVGAVTSSFSFAIARANSLWPRSQGDETWREVINRVEHVSNLLKIPARRLPLKELVPVWTIINSLNQDTLLNPRHSMKVVASACQSILDNSNIQKETLSEFGFILGNERALFDINLRTAEERIRIFDKVVDYAFHLEKRSQDDDMKIVFEFLIAYLAASIGGGGGTTHLELLNPIMQRMPIVSVWYGAISAMYQLGGWGAHYNGLGRLVLRELGYPLRFDEQPRADLSFDELLTAVDPEIGDERLSFRGAGVKNVIIELLPGINISFNLHTRKEVDSNKPANSASGPTPSVKQIEVLGIVSAALNQLEQAKRLLSSVEIGKDTGARVQQSNLPGLPVERDNVSIDQRSSPSSFRSFPKQGKPKK